METVLDILENTRVNSDYHTHVSMTNPKGRYQISRDTMDIFWEKYCDDILEDEKSEKTYGIAEKVQTYIPVLVDVDIKVKFSEEKDFQKLYTEYQVESIVRDYQEVLKTILNNCTQENLICFVLEKPAYKQMYDQTEYIKNGFHLHFPYTFLSKNDHETHLIPRVKKLVSKSKVFANLGIENSGDLIDDCYVRNPWLLYGSRKEGSGMQPYLLSYIFDHEREKISIGNALRNYKLFDSNENELNISPNPMYFLPRILSVIPWFREVSELKPNLPSVIKLNLSSEKKRNYDIKNLSENLERARKYLSIISETRSENYSDWMHIGWALYNISDGSDDGLKIWLEFSSRCSGKFDEAGCISIWEKMEPRNMTLGTIAHYAKQDNPIEYTKIVNSYSNEYIKQSIEGSHHDIAKACFERYGHEVVCASITDNLWFLFDQHKWRQIQNGVYLSKKLSEEFVEIFNQKGREIFEKMSKSSDQNDKVLYTNQQRQIQKMISNLKNNNYKTSVMKECREVFYNENFSNQLNKNPYLIGFKNGVYDLKTSSFRPGIPEDYISLQMPIEYSEYSEDDRLVKEVHDFFEKIFPNRNVRQYFMDIASDVFVGGNHKKHVYFWSGEGNNGKSITQMIFEKMLGEYAIKLPTSLIVGKRTQSSAASPELARAGNGVRWAILQEPDKKDVINIGLLKELSGNDTMYVRGLFQSGGEMEPMFKLNVICNEPPQIPHGDTATWNRIRVIPFESTFCKDAPEDYDEQIRTKRFPVDPFFADKIPSLIKPFAWVLLNHRKKGLKLVEPDEVKLATDGYRKQNDIYRQFTEECIISEQGSKINLPALYNRFKDWFKESNPHQTLPTKNDVKTQFTKMWGEPEKGNVWKGHRELTAEDRDNEDAMFIELNE